MKKAVWATFYYKWLIKILNTINVLQVLKAGLNGGKQRLMKLETFKHLLFLDHVIAQAIKSTKTYYGIYYIDASKPTREMITSP